MNRTELAIRQNEFFASGATKAPEFRKDALKRLAAEIKNSEKRICGALYSDLRKCEFEARTTETNMVVEEAYALIANLKRYMRPKSAAVSMLNFPASGRIMPEPYGRALIFSAWNYPFQLLFSPLLGAVAAGNCVVLKPAEQAPATAELAAEIISKVFPEEHVALRTGGHDVSAELLSGAFDYIFYTGGTGGGRTVMRAAAEHLTPLTLELGGKSPCIVDSDAKTPLSAKRLVWGKFLNAGQTCVAPDYALVHASLKERFIGELGERIRDFYGTDPAASPDYPRIVSERHCDRLAALLAGQKPVIGGEIDRASRYIAPTVLVDPPVDSPVMTEEIFGPILPVLSFETIEEAIAFVNARPKPLALYYFSNGKKNLEKILSETSSGGVCVNETIMHLVNPAMPFGGVGASGFGAYHGKATFDTFTHYKSVMIKSNLIDPPMRYPPKLDRNLAFLKFISK